MAGDSETKRGMALRLFVMMALQLGIWGSWAPKLFPYMNLLGLGAGQQSLVGSSWGIASIVGIFFSNQFADRTFSAERFLATSHLLSGLCLLGVAMSHSFWSLFVCYLGYSLLYVPTLSVANGVAFAHLADPARDFGSIRAGGTLGWVIASWPFVFLLGARTTLADMRWIFIVSATFSFVLAAYALSLPHTPPRAGTTRDPLAWRRAISMLKHPYVAILFAVTFLDSVVHNGYCVIADAFLTYRVGIAGNLSMVVLSLGQISEIVTMLILGRVLAAFGWKITMTVGIAGHFVRFLTFAFLPDAVPFIIVAQLLHGVCYAFFFATLYIFVDDAFPNDVRTSAQGLFNLQILGIGMVIASFLFPALVSTFTYLDPAGRTAVDYRSLFLVPAGLAAAAASLLLFAFSPPSRGPGEMIEVSPPWADAVADGAAP